jgi:hypothetical protein
MSINLMVVDGIVSHVALRYDASSKPELRFTLTQQAKDWPLYLPCCAVGSAATRLAEEIENGQHIVLNSGQLCYRRRPTKERGEQSRMEILVWAVDVLSASAQDERTDASEGDSPAAEEIVPPEGSQAVMPAQVRRPREPKWTPEPSHQS